RQALVNLLSNAVKYNRSGGAVMLNTVRSNGHVRINVSDTGLGIPDEAISRLFEPFDRIGQERSDIEGTGLGLALTKGLVEAMHGRIGVSSTEGEGSTFWVELEAAEPPSIDISEAPVTEVPVARTTVREILYVEDNLANVEIVDRVVMQEKPGLRLVAMSSGAEALAYLETHRPGMVLLDLHLSDMNGDEILERIREDGRLRDMPVVMLSADVSASQIARLTAMGASEYLTKPVRIKTLVRVIDDAL